MTLRPKTESLLPARLWSGCFPVYSRGYVFGQIVAQRVIVRIAFRLSFGGFGRGGLVGGAFFFAFFKGGILQQFGMYTVFQFHSQ